MKLRRKVGEQVLGELIFKQEQQQHPSQFLAYVGS